jgi:hypothetical protein
MVSRTLFDCSTFFYRFFYFLFGNANFKALFVWYFRHGWQLTATEAPMAINRTVRLSNVILYHLLYTYRRRWAKKDTPAGKI